MNDSFSNFYRCAYSQFTNYSKLPISVELDNLINTLIRSVASNIKFLDAKRKIVLSEIILAMLYSNSG